MPAVIFVKVAVKCLEMLAITIPKPPRGIRGSVVKSIVKLIQVYKDAEAS